MRVGLILMANVRNHLHKQLFIYISLGLAFHLCFLLMVILEGLRPFGVITQFTETCLGLSIFAAQG